MKYLLLFALCGFARAQENSFSPSLYSVEATVAITALAADSYATARDTRWRYHEMPFPYGSSWLLGSYPSMRRVVISESASNFAAYAVAFQLQHSRVRALRSLGHAIMIGNALNHVGAASWDLATAHRPR